MDATSLSLKESVADIVRKMPDGERTDFLQEMCNELRDKLFNEFTDKEVKIGLLESHLKNSLAEVKAIQQLLKQEIS